MSGFVVTKLDASIYGWCKNYDCPFFADYHGGKVIDGKDPEQMATSVECDIKPVLGLPGKRMVRKSCPRDEIFGKLVNRFIELATEAKEHALIQEDADEMRHIGVILHTFATDEEKARLTEAGVRL